MPAPDTHFTSGRPITMGFLWDVIDMADEPIERPNIATSSSPSLTKSVIVATLCGWTLEYRQRYSVVHPPPQAPPQLMHYHPHYQDREAAVDGFCRRYRSLNTLLNQQIKTLRIHFTSPLKDPDPDPVYLFVALAACMAVFVHYETLESNPLGTEGQAVQVVETLLAEHKQHLLEVVRGLGAHITALREQSYFQVGLIIFSGAVQGPYVSRKLLTRNFSLAYRRTLSPRSRSS